MAAPDWALLALLAVLMVAISIGVAASYQLAPPSLIASFDYSYLVFAAFWGFVVFAESPDSRTVLGMALIAGAGVASARADQPMRRRTARPTSID